MVLSNKKQKQKLRAAKAGLLAAYPEKNIRDSNSLSIFTGQDSQKVNISKREKRRQKAQHENLDGSKSKETNDDAGKKKAETGGNANEMKPDGVEVKEKKKRKRDDSKALQVNMDGNKSNEISDDAEKMKADELHTDGQEVKKKKKRKRDDSKASEDVKDKPVPLKKKKKKPKKKNKAKKNLENGLVKDVGELNGSKPNGEQLVATLDASSKRSEVAEVVPDKVYVGGIPYYSTEDDIRSYFEHCGTITEVDCMTFADTGKFRGIAILSFKTEAAAKRALALNGSDMGGLFLKIQPFKSVKVNKTINFAPSVMEGYNRIYVGNLSWDITDDDLKNLFSGCNISEIRWGTDKETGEFKGYGHVDFADSVSLNNALKLDQTVLYGRPVKISCAVPKKGAVSNLRSIPKDDQSETVNVSSINEEPKSMQNHNQVDTVKVTHESTQMDIEPESVKITSIRDDQVNSSAVTPVSSKIKRRTCYECGEKGHLSSACPNIPAADSTNPEAKYIQPENVKTSTTTKGEDLANSSAATLVNSKIKRRTCYECGEKGHLSSACPNKPAADSTNPEAKYIQPDSVKITAIKEEDQSNKPAADFTNPDAKYIQSERFKITAIREDQANSSGVTPVSSKIRRRTCYECGEKGHLSSACPNIPAADSTNSEAKLF